MRVYICSVSNFIQFFIYSCYNRNICPAFTLRPFIARLQRCRNNTVVNYQLFHTELLLAVIQQRCSRDAKAVAAAMIRPRWKFQTPYHMIWRMRVCSSQVVVCLVLKAQDWNTLNWIQHVTGNFTWINLRLRWLEWRISTARSRTGAMVGQSWRGRHGWTS